MPIKAADITDEHSALVAVCGGEEMADKVKVEDYSNPPVLAPCCALLRC